MVTDSILIPTGFTGQLVWFTEDTFGDCWRWSQDYANGAAVGPPGAINCNAVSPDAQSDPNKARGAGSGAVTPFQVHSA